MRGRYNPDFAEQAYKLCLLGATNPELADFFGVVSTSIQNWIIKKPDFRDAVLRGKAKADAEVAHKLYQRATGYRVSESETTVGEDGKEITHTKTRLIAPSVTACIFWLKNRARDRWRDKHEYTIGEKSVDDLPDDELLERLISAAAAAGISLAVPGDDNETQH